MFWRLGLHYQESNVNKILESEDCTLEKLLEEDEILTECKAHNEKLVTFLATAENVGKLIELLTTIPNDANEQREKKYPHQACEIICCDIGDIFDVLLDEKNGILEKFLSFLLQPAPLHQALTGYFYRVFLALLGRKPNQLVKFFQSDSQKWVSAMLGHIGSFGIPELLLRLMGAEPSAEESDIFGLGGMGGMQLRTMGGQLRFRGGMESSSEEEEPLSSEDNVKWWLSQGVIDQLLLRLNADESSEVHANVASFICDLARRFAQAPTCKTVMEHLLSENVIRTLIDCVVHSKTPSVLTQGLSILSELLHTVQEHDEELDADEVHVVYRVLSDNLDSLLFLLEPGEKLVQLSTTVQVLAPPLGQARLRVVQFFESLFSAGKTFVDNRLAEIHVLPKIMDLFFQYEWHNILHCIVDRIFKQVIAGSNEALKAELFNECKIVRRILTAVRTNDRECSRARGHRKGYMGHVLSMAAMLENQSSMDLTVSEHLEAANPDWQRFAKGKLAEVLTTEARSLGGSTNWQGMMGSGASAGQDQDEEDGLGGDWDELEESVGFDEFEREVAGLSGGDAAAQDSTVMLVDEVDSQATEAGAGAASASAPAASAARPISASEAGVSSPPPTAAAGAEGSSSVDQQYNAFNYWKTPLPDVDYLESMQRRGK